MTTEVDVTLAIVVGLFGDGAGQLIGYGQRNHFSRYLQNSRHQNNNKSCPKRFVSEYGK